MLASAAAGLACGAILGSRFKVLILVPAHLLAIVVAIGLAMAGALGVGWACLACVIWSVGCNLGYLVAAIVASTEAPRSDREPVPPPLHRARP